MAVRNFVFRQDWVGMKKNFFAIFNPTWTHILPQKTQIRIFLNSVLVKKDRNYIITKFPQNCSLSDKKSQTTKN